MKPKHHLDAHDGPPLTLRLIISRKYPFVRISGARLRDEVDALRKENDDLRARLVEAQKAKGIAVKQAEELRKEKERLRLSAVAAKQANSVQDKTIEQLRSRISDLQGELARSEEKLKRKGSSSRR